MGRGTRGNASRGAGEGQQGRGRRPRDRIEMGFKATEDRGGRRQRSQGARGREVQGHPSREGC